jgi:uncharacterized protein YydD (DUF2326 family)
LFGLPATIEDECRKLDEEIKENRHVLESKWKLLSARKVTGADKIENLKRKISVSLKKIQSDIEDVKVSSSLEDVRERYFEVRNELTEVNTEINKKEHYLEGYESNLKALEEKSTALSELLKVNEFYQDLIEFFPEQISKNISKFNEFFTNVSRDRERYYSDLILDLKSDLKFLKNEKKRIEPELENLSIQFKNSSILKDISLLTAEEERLRSELRGLDDLKIVLTECENLEEKIAKLEGVRKKKIDEGKQSEKKNREKRKRIINLFHDLVSEVYGVDDAVLEFDYVNSPESDVAGRTEIVCSIPSQGSHGRTYAKINIFDFVWFLREREPDEFDPGFLFHDGSYAKISTEVKQKMINAVTKRLGSKQYFITVNEGELNFTPDLEKQICRTLDGSQTEGKFFREQFE